MVTIQNTQFENLVDYANSNASKCLAKYIENVLPQFQFKINATSLTVQEVKLQKPDLTLIDVTSVITPILNETDTATYVTLPSYTTYPGNGYCGIFRFRVKVSNQFYYSEWFDSSYSFNSDLSTKGAFLSFKNAKDIDGYLFSEDNFVFSGLINAVPKFIGVGEESELSKSNGLNYLVQSSIWDIYQIKFQAIPSVARLLARASHWDTWTISVNGVDYAFLGYPEIKIEPNLDLFDVTITYNVNNAYISPQIPNETII